MIVAKVAAEHSRQWHFAGTSEGVTSDLTLCGRVVRRRRGSPLASDATLCQVCRFNRDHR